MTPYWSGHNTQNPVIPANAGIQRFSPRLDSRILGNDSDVWLNKVTKIVNNLKQPVTPAQAGIQKPLIFWITPHWTPAYAGVTGRFSTPC